MYLKFRDGDVPNFYRVNKVDVFRSGLTGTLVSSNNIITIIIDSKKC